MTNLDPRVAATMNVDGADNAMVLAAVLGCALGWEADARIIGNVRAGDIVRALQALSASPSPPALDGAGRDAVIEECAKVAFERAHDNHKKANAYGANGDDASQLSCMTAAVEAMEIAAAIRSIKETP